MEEAFSKIKEAAGGRIAQLHQMMLQDWQDQHPGEEIAYLVNVEIGGRVRIQGDEEILKEWINAPVRDALAARELDDIPADRSDLMNRLRGASPKPPGGYSEVVSPVAGRA